ISPCLFCQLFHAGGTRTSDLSWAAMSMWSAPKKRVMTASLSAIASVENRYRAAVPVRATEVVLGVHWTPCLTGDATSIEEQLPSSASSLRLVTRSHSGDESPEQPGV